MKCNLRIKKDKIVLLRRDEAQTSFLTTRWPVWVLSTGAATLTGSVDLVLSDYKTHNCSLK